jgi:hypothetical protein
MIGARARLAALAGPAGEQQDDIEALTGEQAIGQRLVTGLAQAVGPLLQAAGGAQRGGLLPGAGPVAARDVGQRRFEVGPGAEQVVAQPRPLASQGGGQQRRIGERGNQGIERAKQVGDNADVGHVAR